MDPSPAHSTTEDRVNNPQSAHTFFKNDEERREVATNFALKGQSLDEALKPLRTSFERRLKAIHSLFEAKLLELKSSISAKEKSITEAEEAIALNREQIRKLRDEDRNLDTSRTEFEATLQDSWQRLRHARYAHGKEFFKEHQASLESELHHQREEINAETQHRLGISQQHHEVETKNYEANKEEFARRVGICNQEKLAVEAQLSEAQKHADKLKAFGLTRTTATFLFVVGFISIAGSGSAISSLISDRQPGEPIFSLLLQHLISYGQANIHGPWRFVVLALLPPAIVVTLFFGLIGLYLLLLLIDRLVKKFDPSWQSGKAERRDRQRSRLQDQFTNIASKFTGLTSQFGNLQSFDVERRHYTKLLASFPYILIGGVIFFLFSGVAFYESEHRIVINLTTTYIGVTITLLATTFWLIYITKVIEPRWERAAAYAAGHVGTRRQLWANRELVGLLLLLVLGLALAGLLPTSGVRTSIPTSTNT
jgi:hypothetical protein